MIESDSEDVYLICPYAALNGCAIFKSYVEQTGDKNINSIRSRPLIIGPIDGSIDSRDFHCNALDSLFCGYTEISSEILPQGKNGEYWAPAEGKNEPRIPQCSHLRMLSHLESIGTLVDFNNGKKR